MYYGGPEQTSTATSNPVHPQQSPLAPHWPRTEPNLECGDSSPLWRRRLVAVEPPSSSAPARAPPTARAVIAPILTFPPKFNRDQSSWNSGDQSATTPTVALLRMRLALMNNRGPAPHNCLSPVVPQPVARPEQEWFGGSQARAPITVPIPRDHPLPLVRTTHVHPKRTATSTLRPLKSTLCPSPSSTTAGRTGTAHCTNF